MENKLPAELESAIRKLRETARVQRALPAAVRNKALLSLADALVCETKAILAANAEDLKRLKAGEPAAFRDRLTLTEARIAGMAESLRQVAALPDPVGEVVEQKVLSNGLKVRRVRAPLGVIFMVFESRPNVITEAFSLAYKSGNVIILRGGSESRSTADVIYALMEKSLGTAAAGQGGAGASAGTPFLGVKDYNRDIVAALLKRKDLIDITVPRGGDALIEFVQKTATMPIIKNDRGLCHTYIDEDADLDMAVRIVDNAKTQRPGVCNSLETVLVHEKVAAQFLPKLHAAGARVGLQWRVDSTSSAILNGLSGLQVANEKDWDTEHLDLIMNCKVVKSMDEALQHIERYGSKHSEAIVTKSEAKARRFQDEVDAAAVYWNASTRFTDGFELGLGGELGISTQKLHVRGPVGLRELTTPRWVIDGTGQVRG